MDISKLYKTLADKHVPSKDLPEPRLELVFGSWLIGEVLDLEEEPVMPDYWFYRLVYKHFDIWDCKDLVSVPLGFTSTDLHGRKPNFSAKEPDMPIRDGVHAMHDSSRMNLPLFLIQEGEEPRLYVVPYEQKMGFIYR